jgi:hypothetical protein
LGWIDEVLRTLPFAYAFVTHAFHGAGGGEAGLAAANTAYATFGAEWRLSMQLLAAEKLVERVLARRHVEDMHLSCRVHIFRHDDVAAMRFSDAYSFREAAAHFLEAAMRQIQYVANCTAAYRFLRHKSCLRQWRRLLHLCSDDANYAAADVTPAGGSAFGTPVDAGVGAAAAAALAASAAAYGADTSAADLHAVAAAAIAV